jgi:hypothetical protein
VSLSTDQKIALWNTVGVWVAGVATTMATISALWIAYMARRTKLRAWCTVDLTPVDGTRHLTITVTNEGDRLVEIPACAWVIGRGRWRDKHHAIFDPNTEYSDPLPYTLTPAKTAHFRIRLSEDPTFFSAFARGYLKGRDLQTLRAVVFPSVGNLMTIKPSQDVLDIFRCEVDRVSD